jgi:hypothetical protein
MVICRFNTGKWHEMDRDETGQGHCAKGLVFPHRSFRIRPFTVAANVAKWDILPLDTEQTTPRPLYQCPKLIRSPIKVIHPGAKFQKPNIFKDVMRGY